MKIVQLDIEGFRSLKNVSWKPGDLNVIIGPNGSGKSNLLRMLEMISAAAQGQLSAYVQDAGGMEALVWDGQVRTVSFKLLTSPMEGLPANLRHSLTYEVELVRLGLGSSYTVASELLGDYHLVDLGQKPEPFKYLERKGLSARIFDEQAHSFVAPEDAILEEDTILSLAAGPFTNNKGIPPFQRQLSTWRVHQDVYVNRDAAIRESAVARMERRVAPNGQNLINVLHTLYTSDREFKRRVNSAMRAAFGDDFDEVIFPPASDQRIQMRVRWKTLKREQSAADLSDGTLRFLFLLAVLASPDPPPLIAVDEPEAGLHPSMLPLVAELAVNAAERTQVIFTTHSDQFLDAFRETGIRPTTTVAMWENGETTLTTLDDTDLEYWLKEYSLGSLFRSGELENMAS